MTQLPTPELTKFIHILKKITGISKEVIQNLVKFLKWQKWTVCIYCSYQTSWTNTKSKKKSNDASRFCFHKISITKRRIENWIPKFLTFLGGRGKWLRNTQTYNHTLNNWGMGNVNNFCSILLVMQRDHLLTIDDGLSMYCCSSSFHVPLVSPVLTPNLFLCIHVASNVHVKFQSLPGQCHLVAKKTDQLND